MMNENQDVFQSQYNGITFTGHIRNIRQSFTSAIRTERAERLALLGDLMRF